MAACVALVVAAIGDAGPEIVESRSLIAGYDGPGPLIYLGAAVLVAAVRWRFMPLLAVVTGAFFLVGGFSDASFLSRLGSPGEPIPFCAGWLQMAGFAAAAGFGIAAVLRERSAPVAVAGDTIVTTATRLSLFGLAGGVLGLAIQWFADPGKFPLFPPGIVFIVVCGALVLFTVRHWWAPVFAVLISLWIVLGGWAAGQLTPNFTSPETGTVVGTAIMSLGLAFAAVTGAAAMIEAWRSRAG